MSGKEEEEEKDQSLFIPFQLVDASNDISSLSLDDLKALSLEVMSEHKRYQEGILTLREQLAALKRKAKELKDEYDLWSTSMANLTFKLERERGASKYGRGWLWTAFLLGLLACMFHSWDKASFHWPFGPMAYIFALGNGWAFLANWRTLYVHKAKHSFLAGMIVIMLTLYLI